MKKLGLALGGGGTRGFAHLGVIKALEEKGIRPDVFSGTSAGAIVGALLAAEKTPDEIMEIMKDIKITDAAKIKFPMNGFATLDNLGSHLNKLLEGKTFSDLEYPLNVSVSNLNTGKVEYINRGNVAKAVQASSSIPLLFSPVSINGQFYIDGGLLDNVPVKPLIDQCDQIIAVDIMPIKELERIEGITEIISQIFHMSVSMQPDKEENCDIVIKLEELSEYHILDTSQNEKIFDIGYNYVKKLDLTCLTDLI